MYFRSNLGDYDGLRRAEITLKPLYSGFSSPVDMVFSKYTYIADQTGQIIVVDPATGSKKVALDLAPILAKLKPTNWRAKAGLNKKYDERGLLGITLHPDFPKNPRIYVYYSHPTTKKEFNHLSRLSVFHFLDWDKIDPQSEKVLLEIDQEAHSHNGGGLHFGPDGYLYLSLGDGQRRKYKKGEMGNAQDVSNLKGSLLRIDVSADTAKAPPDNPLVNYSKANPLIWVWGLRNPWRFSFDRATNKCFVGDVGEHHRESIYQVQGGDNCGWRMFEGRRTEDLQLLKKLNIDFDMLKMPLFDYGPDVGRSVIGGYIYRGKARPDLQGLYIFADASKTWPWRAFFQGPVGAIYALKKTAKGWEQVPLKVNNFPKQLVASLSEDTTGELYVLTKSVFGPTGQTGVVSKLF